VADGDEGRGQEESLYCWRVRKNPCCRDRGILMRLGRTATVLIKSRCPENKAGEGGG